MLAERMKIVRGLSPHLANNHDLPGGDYVSMKGYGKLTIVIQTAQAGHASAVQFKLHKATDVAGGGEVIDQTVTHFWTNADCATTDTLVKGVTTGTTDITTTAAQTDQMIVIEISSDEFPGYDCFAVHSEAGNAGNYKGIIYILSEPRYAQATPPSAILD